MERSGSSEWYFDFVKRLEDSKQTMLDMGFEKVGVEELIEEMRGIAMGVKQREESRKKIDVEGWENEGGFVPDDDVVQY